MYDITGMSKEMIIQKSTGLQIQPASYYLLLLSLKFSLMGM